MRREDIKLISKHSNWSKNGIQEHLESDVYASSDAWNKFIKLLLLSLGIGFTTAGILFFFAYNWVELHDFVKLGLLALLLISTTLLGLYKKFSKILRQLLITASSILIGVLFGVYGQIYQTGADAYDLFLVWTLAITLWVIASRFYPLWFMFSVLLNTTLILYAAQKAFHWEDSQLFLFLGLLNTVATILTLFKTPLFGGKASPTWFIYTQCLGAIVFITIGLSIGLHNSDLYVYLLALLCIGFYALLALYSFRIERSFYLGSIAGSLIIILSSLIISWLTFDFSSALFITGFFVIISTTYTIKQLLSLQKSWKSKTK